MGLAFAALLRERLLDKPSPLTGLMGRSALMVNLLWAVHLSLFTLDPSNVPLTLGVGLGLHWIVFGWIAGTGVGMLHAVVRTLLVTAAWWAFPDAPVEAVVPKGGTTSDAERDGARSCRFRDRGAPRRSRSP